MKIIGLTGGIGSGKSTVAQLLEDYGIPLYNSDIQAREIMNHSPIIISKLKEWYGDDIYTKAGLDRKKLANIVFKDTSELARLNKLVHPEVFKDFEKWKANQNTPVVLKESAILFESGSYKDCDYTITVSAPIQSRIDRVIKRDQVTTQQVLDRIDKQWTDQQKEELANYTIHNNSTLEMLKEEVKQLFVVLQKKFIENHD